MYSGHTHAITCNSGGINRHDNTAPVTNRSDRHNQRQRNGRQVLNLKNVDGMERVEFQAPILSKVYLRKLVVSGPNLVSAQACNRLQRLGDKQSYVALAQRYTHRVGAPEYDDVAHLRIVRLSTHIPEAACVCVSGALQTTVVKDPVK